MAKPTHSQTTTRNGATGSGTKGRPEAQRKQLPQARRGSVTKPLKKGPPWMPIAISGGLVVLAGLFVVILVAFNSSRSNQTENPPTPVATPPAAGTVAPDFKVTAKDGSTLTKADLAGKPTLLLFFASWCPHCQAEAPKIAALAEANPDLKVVAIGVGYNDTKQGIYDFQSKFSLPFPTYDDGGKAASLYGVNSFPTLFAVDGNGMIRDSGTGELTPDQLNALVAKARGQ